MIASIEQSLATHQTSMTDEWSSTHQRTVDLLRKLDSAVESRVSNIHVAGQQSEISVGQFNQLNTDHFDRISGIKDAASGSMHSHTEFVSSQVSECHHAIMSHAENVVRVARQQTSTMEHSSKSIQSSQQQLEQSVPKASKEVCHAIKHAHREVENVQHELIAHVADTQATSAKVS
jgi:hypothetical protein